MGCPVPEIHGRRDAQEKEDLRSIVVLGLVVYAIIAGLGGFIESGLSSPFMIFWLVGYLLLTFSVSYSAYTSPERFNPFPLIVLGIILLNFLVQVTGGVHSSLWPAYFLFAVLVAVFSPPRRIYAALGVILAIETANVLISGEATGGRWPVYGGFALSLAGVSAAVSHIMNRTRREAEQAKDAHERLLAKADSLDPLSDETKLSALTNESRQAANLKAAGDRENTFNGLIQMIYEFIPAHTYALFLKERKENSEVFSLRAIKTESGHAVLPVGSMLDPHKGKMLIDICADQKQPQYLSDMVIPLSNLGYYRQDVRDVPVKSFLVLPIIHQDRTIAVLAVDSLERGAFSLETQDMLNRFSPFFIEIIEKIQLSHELNIKAQHFAELHKMSSVLSSSLELKEVLDKLTAQIRTVVPYDFCAFLLYDEKSGEAVMSALRGYDSRFAGSRFPVRQSAIMHQMLTYWEEQKISKTYSFPDLGARGREIGLFPIKELQQPLQSLYGRPLAARGRFIGAVFLGSVRTNAFGEYYRKFMDTLLNQVSMVIDNSMLHQRIRDMAHTDGLTGLLNHRTFMEKIEEEFRRLDRENQDFSLLLLDIDYFKKVNDEHGHPVGDAALKSVAGVIREMARSIDFVARYGGEEFAVGMVGANSEGAKTTAERIRKAVEHRAIAAGTVTLRCTLSIGVASYSQGCEKKETLIAQADQALYHAKRSGRNRVCLYRDIQSVDDAAEHARAAR
jgi:diguanylate cyclase (GGDEF)-like protein